MNAMRTAILALMLAATSSYAWANVVQIDPVDHGEHPGCSNRILITSPLPETAFLPLLNSALWLCELCKVGRDRYGVFCSPPSMLILNYPCLRPMRSNSQEQPVAVANHSVALRVGLCGFTGHGGKFSHLGFLGGILGGNAVGLGGNLQEHHGMGR